MRVSPTFPNLERDRLARGRGRLLTLAVAGAVLALGGCSRFGDSMLEIAPTSFSECEGPNTVVRVTWNATSVVHNGHVRLFVYKPGGRPRLWIEAAPAGSAETGRWASDGWTVTLVGDEDRLLAMRTLQSEPCVATAR